MFVPEPDGAPQNVRGHNISSTSISGSWDQVPVEQENGIITGYTITYHSQTENDNGTVQAGPSERQKEITGLKEYVNYNITVFASTVKGDGPPSTPVLVVRTDQDGKLFLGYKPSLYSSAGALKLFIYTVLSATEQLAYTGVRVNRSTFHFEGFYVLPKICIFQFFPKRHIM